jgi:para-nitrobenzyl esterase
MSWTIDTAATPAPVTVESGALAGITRVNEAGQRVRAWLGIPYAAPPLGELRWRPPQPVRPWPGLRAADRLAPQCIQPPRKADSLYAEYSGVQAMSEDCLTLNVFSAAAPGERLPVMVWIHGGGHRQGAGSNPVFTEGTLPLQGVVLVTINYRLGPLGFLCHPELEAEGTNGNYALMDQTAALAWVRRNIAAFGGDPACVTVFGQSAGGEAVGALLASPPAHGLFDRAIVMSLGATRPMEPAGQRARLGAAWAKKLGASTLAALRALPAEALLTLEHPAGFVVDGHTLPESGYAAFAAGHQARVPLLAGWTADDGSVFAPPVAPDVFAGKVRAAFGPRADEVLALYPPGQTERVSQDLFREQLFAWPAWSTVRLHAPHAPAFLYQFRHPQPFRPEQSFTEASPASRAGAFHSSDYPYIFGTLGVLDRAWTAADHALSAQMQARWTAFARTGSPDAPGLPAWPRYDDAAPALMALQPAEALLPLPDADRLAFFDSWFAAQHAA